MENIRGALVIKWLGLRTDGLKGPVLNADAGGGCSRPCIRDPLSCQLKLLSWAWPVVSNSFLGNSSWKIHRHRHVHKLKSWFFFPNYIPPFMDGFQRLSPWLIQKSRSYSQQFPFHWLPHFVSLSRQFCLPVNLWLGGLHYSWAIFKVHHLE